MIPFDFQYPSFTVYQHTVAPVLALLCKHIRHLNIEASGRTWDWASFPFSRGSKLEMWRSGILVKSSLSIKLSIKILTLTTSKLFPDFCLTLKNFDLFLTFPDRSNPDDNNLLLCVFGAYHIFGLWDSPWALYWDNDAHTNFQLF